MNCLLLHALHNGVLILMGSSGYIVVLMVIQVKNYSVISPGVYQQNWGVFCSFVSSDLNLLTLATGISSVELSKACRDGKKHDFQLEMPLNKTFAEVVNALSRDCGVKPALWEAESIPGTPARWCCALKCVPVPNMLLIIRGQLLFRVIRSWHCLVLSCVACGRAEFLTSSFFSLVACKPVRIIQWSFWGTDDVQYL